MKNHDHKEPPLQEKVNHNKRVITSFVYYVSMIFFALTIGLAFAGPA